MRQAVLCLLLMAAVASSIPVDKPAETLAAISSDNSGAKAIETDSNAPDMEASESGFKKCLKFGGCGGFGHGFGGAPFAPIPPPIAPVAPIGFGTPILAPVGIAPPPVAPIGLGFGAPIGFAPVAPIGGFGVAPVAPFGFPPAFGGFF